ncbi:hypothetical protein Acsp05_65150 [Actinokineospora sp. NBRC 105648]|nr:hypothetical protein Acsp05_65150 [Actinokineospora sp. NBRC 105648]
MGERTGPGRGLFIRDQVDRGVRQSPEFVRYRAAQIAGAQEFCLERKLASGWWFD